MPTLRLGDSERRSIKSDFGTILDRALNNQPFPLKASDFPEFGYSLLSPQMAIHYKALREDKFGKHVTSCSSWRPEINIRADDFKYELSLSGNAAETPCDGLEVMRSHPKYAEILAWSEHYSEVHNRVGQAKDLVREIVGCSTSIGQVHRLLAEEVLRFVPQHMLGYLQQAERRSRVPANYNMDHHIGQMDNLVQTLALGSLSPAERAGDIGATVDKRKPIA